MLPVTQFEAAAQVSLKESLFLLITQLNPFGGSDTYLPAQYLLPASLPTQSNELGLCQIFKFLQSDKSGQSEEIFHHHSL